MRAAAASARALAEKIAPLLKQDAYHKTPVHIVAEHAPRTITARPHKSVSTVAAAHAIPRIRGAVQQHSRSATKPVFYALRMGAAVITTAQMETSVYAPIANSAILRPIEGAETNSSMGVQAAAWMEKNALSVSVPKTVQRAA